MKNFDLFIGIDWSGAKSPINTKSIALATLGYEQKTPTLYSDIRSRTSVAQFFIDLTKKDQRVLVGIDCNFGYAQDVGEKQFGKYYTYKDLWQAVEDANKDTPNYFAGGFWEEHKNYFWTEGKMREGFTMPKRLTEIQCAADGYGVPESPFKLIGAKQVGKGGLAGMRMAYDLKKILGDQIAIWPFEDKVDKAKIVMTEIYPRQFLKRVGHGNTKVRTLDDLNLCLKALEAQAYPQNKPFSDHDADALVSAAGLRMLCGSSKTAPDNIAFPPMLDKKRAQREGWIFGVGDKS